MFHGGRKGDGCIDVLEDWTEERRQFVAFLMAEERKRRFVEFFDEERN